MDIELLIEHSGTVMKPVVVEGITWETTRAGAPSVLKFSVVKDGKLNFQEGDAVRLKVDGSNVFFGFVFTKQRTKDETISVTAYDQLRYLKNKDTISYVGKKASEVIKMLADDFGLKCGNISSTQYTIPKRNEPNKTLFDIVQTALDLELQNAGNMYVLYDDFGKLALKNISEMNTGVVIDGETAENFNYTSTIDSNTYDKIKLTFDNEKTGKRETYIAKDGSHINAWGVLQYHEQIQSGENGQAKADALLKLYNAKTRSLKVTNALGDVSCRAGAIVTVKLNLGDVSGITNMLIETAQHKFDNNIHTMSLTLRGGTFNA